MLDTKRLHRNIIPINYNGESTQAMHSHRSEKGDFITPTDICTLMLYGKTANWQTQLLTVLTTEAARKIAKSE